MIDLNKYRWNTYSQGGEDGIISKIFTMLQIDKGYCLELGAGDGMKISNTRRLREKGWHTVLIEGDASEWAKLQSVTNAELVNTYVSNEPGHSLDEILATTSLPHRFDFMSLDIDGNDLHVWSAMKDYTPTVVCVEYNYSFKDSVTIAYDPKHRFNDDNYYGASAAAFDKLARSKGYELIAWTPNLNLFFIDKGIKHPFVVHDVANVPFGGGWPQSPKQMQPY